MGRPTEGEIPCGLQHGSVVFGFVYRLFRLPLPLTDMYKDAHVSHLSVHGIDHHGRMSKIPIHSSS